MMLLIYLVLVIALPAAMGACIVAEKAGRADPTAGFMLLLLAGAMAFGFGAIFQHGTFFEFRYFLGGPGVLVIGMMLGGLLGYRQRRRAMAATEA